MVREVFDDLIATAPRAVAATLAALPDGFPQDVMDSIVAGQNHRILARW